jgi:hypothetical protein
MARSVAVKAEAVHGEVVLAAAGAHLLALLLRGVAEEGASRYALTTRSPCNPKRRRRDQKPVAGPRKTGAGCSRSGGEPTAERGERRLTVIKQYVSVGDPRVEAKWEAIEAAVTTALDGASTVTVRIPQWEPTDLATGLFWLRSNVYEGFHVGFLVEEDGVDAKVLWLKSWEPWDPEAPTDSDEPTWESIKARPISRPKHDWF